LQDTYKRTTEAVLGGHLFGTIGMKMPNTNRRTEEVPNMDLSSGFFL
jgi:hypothetical protein